MYDQYDFESQYLEDQKRRLPATNEPYIDNPEQPISLNRRFSTQGPTGLPNDVHYYSHDPASDVPWQWFRAQADDPDTGLNVYQQEDVPPHCPACHLMYIPSTDDHPIKAGTHEKDGDEIKNNAIFVAYGKRGFEHSRYFYSFTNDQWWDTVNTGGVEPSEKSGHDLWAVDHPDFQHSDSYKIAYVKAQGLGPAGGAVSTVAPPIAYSSTY